VQLALRFVSWRIAACPFQPRVRGQLKQRGDREFSFARFAFQVGLKLARKPPRVNFMHRSLAHYLRNAMVDAFVDMVLVKGLGTPGRLAQLLGRAGVRLREAL
jgi:hypothetical protein